MSCCGFSCKQVGTDKCSHLFSFLYKSGFSSFKLGIIRVIYKQRGSSSTSVMTPLIVCEGSCNRLSSPERLPYIPVIVELVCLFSLWMESCWLSMFRLAGGFSKPLCGLCQPGCSRACIRCLCPKRHGAGWGCGWGVAEWRGHRCLWAAEQCMVWTRSGKVRWLKSVHSFLSLTVCRHVKR